MTRTLVTQLAESVRRGAERCALIDQDRQLSYGQLWNEAEALANHFRQLKLEAGEGVAICLENSLEYVVAMYGSLMAGATIIPIHPRSTESERRELIEHSGAAFSVSRSEPSGAPSAAIWCGAHVQLEIVTCTGSVDASHTRLRALGDSLRPTALLCTSGSSGKPKAVMLSHENLVSNAEGIARALDIQPQDRTLLALPAVHAYGNSVLTSHLARGATLVLERRAAYPAAVLATCLRQAVTTLPLVPPGLAQLVRGTSPSAWSGCAVRTVTLAGGATSKPLLEALRRHFPLAQTFIMYGQTEATARLTVLRPSQFAGDPRCVGAPIEGTEIEIRAADGSLQAVGQEGFVFVRGPGIMLGYLADPGETARVLDQRGWLRTGDIGFLDDQGLLHLRGRQQGIVKVGGYRVSIAEIESVLSELDGVGEVVATPVDDDERGASIKAFVVPEPGCDLTSSALRRYCRQRLAPHKRPALIELVDQLPRLASGKLDRNSLTRVPKQWIRKAS